MDAYLVIYSTQSQESYDDAVYVLHEIRKSQDRDNKPLIFLATKTDLYNSRLISEKGEFEIKI